MNYLKITNMHWDNLFDRSLVPGSRYNWAKYGINIQQVQQLHGNGEVGGINVKVLPIADIDKMNQHIDVLQARAAKTPLDNDAVEIISESDADTLKALWVV